MRKRLIRLAFLVPTVFFLAMLFALSPITASTSLAAPATAATSTWTGYVTSAANVRTGPTTRAARVATYAAGTHVTVYATVSGQLVWGGIRSWYRISSLSSAPRYIYGGLVAHLSSGSSGSKAPTTSSKGKVIIVSLSQQKLYAYQNGTVVFTTLVTTGMPALRTPTGTFTIFRKISNVTFISPWPKGSPYYYTPEHVDYALQITWSGIYLHDSPWRTTYGPGTEAHGSHGCVNMPYAASKWLYAWAALGTQVRIVD